MSRQNRPPAGQYRDGSDDGSVNGLEEEVPMIEKDGVFTKTVKGRQTKLVTIMGVLLLASVVGNVVLFSCLFLRRQDLDAISLKHTSQYWSPIMDGVKIRYESVRFNGSFIHKSIYQQSPGPEVDKAWSDLGIDFRTTVVPEDKWLEAGMDPSAVKVQKSQGGGFLTNVEVLHHIHCLNMIRQTLPWNVDYYRSRGEGVYENSEPIVQMHVDHCVEIIRQQLQCSSDVGMFGQRWIQRKGKEMNVFPIFDTVHRCRNFDDILAWARDNQAADGLVAEVRDDDVIMDAYP